MVNPKSVGALARTHVVFFDVDGVFTDGKSWQDQTGQWRRTFSVRDTMGVRALRKAGLKVCVLSPVFSPEVRAHFEKVGVDSFTDHCLDLTAAQTKIVQAFGYSMDHAAFVTETAGGEVELRTKDASLYIAARAGGDGAVLEISNLILQLLASRPAAPTDIRMQAGEL